MRMKKDDVCKWWKDFNGGWDSSCGGNHFIQDVSFANDPELDVGECYECHRKIKVVELAE